MKGGLASLWLGLKPFIFTGQKAACLYSRLSRKDDTMKRLTAALSILGVLVLQSPQVLAEEPIEPINPPKSINLGLAELGKKLYFDPRLSKSGFISCNSCHNLSMGGTDNLPTSIGDKWQQGPINAPTVLNSSLNLAQFWDGRAADLKAQAGGPIANPGQASIRAAVFPEKTKYLYFVSRNNGTHVFSENYKKHLNAVKEYQMNPKKRQGRSWRQLKNKKKDRL